jgi:hypothetical protein
MCPAQKRGRRASHRSQSSARSPLSLGSPETTHARLDLAPSFDGELPVQVTTQASGLDGNDCGQQVAQVDGTPSFDATVQARRPGPVVMIPARHLYG